MQAASNSTVFFVAESLPEIQTLYFTSHRKLYPYCKASYPALEGSQSDRQAVLVKHQTNKQAKKPICCRYPVTL